MAELKKKLEYSTHSDQPEDNNNFEVLVMTPDKEFLAIKEVWVVGASVGSGFEILLEAENVEELVVEKD